MTAPKEWYTAAELAGLPGMPGTERRVRSRAEREVWKSRPRTGRGGGREYHISALPEITRQHLGCRNAAIAALTLEIPAPWYVRAVARLLRPAIREALRREHGQ